jgi:hypothetical protein
MANNTLNAPNYAEMLSNPEFQKKLMEGFAKGRALAQTMEQTPMQPDITAESIQPEPQYIEPATTTYTGFKDAAPVEPSIYEKMQGAVNPKDQQKLLYQLMSQSMQQQQEGIRQAQEALKKEQERQAKMSALEKIDLRPFAEAIRSYGSTTVAPVAAPEMTETQRQEMLRKLQAQVQGAQEGMTKEQVAALRTMMQEKDAKSNMQALLSMGNQEMRAFENVQRKFDKPIKDINDFYQSHDAVKSALDSGDIYAIQSSLSNYARMSGEKGVLTDEDIKRVMPANLQNKFAIWWSRIKSDPTVKAPEGVIQALNSGLGRLRTAAETKARKSLELAKGQASKGPGVYKKYANDIFEEASQSIRSKEAEAGESLMPSPDVFKAEDERRAKAKAAAQEKK